MNLQYGWHMIFQVIFNEPIESVFLFEESERKSRAQISRGEYYGYKKDKNI